MNHETLLTSLKRGVFKCFLGNDLTALENGLNSRHALLLRGAIFVCILCFTTESIDW
jgi:hypothetical protein